MSDDEATQYVNEFLQGDARRLHSLVAANPLAATRCFHWTVRLVIRTVFNCEDGPGTAADGIPAHAESGVFGHVRAFFGVVEPQMRKALHVHMLVQLLGFGHPQDLFGTDVLPDTFRRLRYFVASICFRSTEAFAHYLADDAAMDKLASLPLLPLSKKQRGMIGEARSQQSFRAQMAARGIKEVAVHGPDSRPGVHWTSDVLHNPALSAHYWAYTHH